MKKKKKKEKRNKCKLESEKKKKLGYEEEQEGGEHLQNSEEVHNQKPLTALNQAFSNFSAIENEVRDRAVFQICYPRSGAPTNGFR